MPKTAHKPPQHAPQGAWFDRHRSLHSPQLWSSGGSPEDSLDVIAAAVHRAHPDHVLILVLATDARFTTTRSVWQEFGGALSDDGGYMTQVTAFVPSVSTPHGALTLERKRQNAITASLPPSLFDGADKQRSGEVALYSGTEDAVRHLLEGL